MEEKGKRYYVTVKGERIPVTEEVYRAFVRPLRAEQRARRRNFRCVVFSKKRGAFRALQGKMRELSPLSVGAGCNGKHAVAGCALGGFG